jgi:hypothetical protein
MGAGMNIDKQCQRMDFVNFRKKMLQQTPHRPVLMLPIPSRTRTSAPRAGHLTPPDQPHVSFSYTAHDSSQHLQDCSPQDPTPTPFLPLAIPLPRPISSSLLHPTSIANQTLPSSFCNGVLSLALPKMPPPMAYPTPLLWTMRTPSTSCIAPESHLTHQLPRASLPHQHTTFSPPHLTPHFHSAQHTPIKQRFPMPRHSCPPPLHARWA